MEPYQVSNSGSSGESLARNYDDSSFAQRNYSDQLLGIEPDIVAFMPDSSEMFDADYQRQNNLKISKPFFKSTSLPEDFKYFDESDAEKSLNSMMYSQIK